MKPLDHRRSIDAYKFNHTANVIKKIVPQGSILEQLMNFATALSFKEKKMTKAPLPDSVRIGQVSLAVFQTVIFFLKSNFFHFSAKNRISRVKLFEICLISSAKPFFLSAFFLRRPFHAENMVQTIL